MRDEEGPGRVRRLLAGVQGGASKGARREGVGVKREDGASIVCGERDTLGRVGGIHRQNRYAMSKATVRVEREGWRRRRRGHGEDSRPEESFEGERDLRTNS